MCKRGITFNTEWPAINQSINHTSIPPISPVKPGSVARQLNPCSTAKSKKQSIITDHKTWRRLVLMCDLYEGGTRPPGICTCSKPYTTGLRSAVKWTWCTCIANRVLLSEDYIRALFTFWPTHHWWSSVVDTALETQHLVTFVPFLCSIPHRSDIQGSYISK